MVILDRPKYIRMCMDIINSKEWSLEKQIQTFYQEFRESILRAFEAGLMNKNISEFLNIQLYLLFTEGA